MAIRGGPIAADVPRPRPPRRPPRPRPPSATTCQRPSRLMRRAPHREEFPAPAFPASAVPPARPGVGQRPSSGSVPGRDVPATVATAPAGSRSDGSTPHPREGHVNKVGGRTSRISTQVERQKGGEGRTMVGEDGARSRRGAGSGERRAAECRVPSGRVGVWRCKVTFSEAPELCRCLQQ